jgi:hypothetical protein
MKFTVAAQLQLAVEDEVLRLKLVDCYWIG